MFYIQYLTSLCERRSWSEPVFEARRSRSGKYTCLVRVNNREYTSDSSYTSEVLAREKAAEAAYLLCYNFSMNDGMVPGQRQGQAGVTQGLPVAIGTGRRNSRHHSQRAEREYVGVNAYNDASRNSSRSPGTLDGSSDGELHHFPTSRKSSVSSHGSERFLQACRCRRSYVVQHSRCAYCLREAGY